MVTRAKRVIGPSPPHEVPETERPTKEQIRILREQVDPYGMVAFDFMPGKERPAYLKSILEREVQALGS